MGDKQVVAIDFDGTIIEDGYWPEMGPVLPGAAYALRFLSERYHILIYTCRTAPTMPDGTVRTDEDKRAELKAIHELLVGMGLGWIEIWQGPHKPMADLYIDNKGWRFLSWTPEQINGMLVRLMIEEQERHEHRQLVLC